MKTTLKIYAVASIAFGLFASTADASTISWTPNAVKVTANKKTTVKIDGGHLSEIVVTIKQNGRRVKTLDDPRRFTLVKGQTANFFYQTGFKRDTFTISIPHAVKRVTVKGN